MGAEEEDWIVILRGEDDLNLTGDWRQSNEVTGDGQCETEGRCYFLSAYDFAVALVMYIICYFDAMLLLECICFCSSPSDV